MVENDKVKTGNSSFRRAQWRMLLATMFCYLFFYTGRQTAGFAIPGIHEELGISLTMLGWMSATLFWCYAVGQFINGNLGDMLGARGMMSLGAVISCALNWVVSFGQGVSTLFIPWGANGFAQSMAWAPGSRLISNWWGQHERGKAFGLYVFIAGMSSVLAFTTSLIVLDVLELGWRWIFRLPVLLMLVGGATYFFIARNRPEDLGFQIHLERSEAGGSSSEKDEVDTEHEETTRERYAAVFSNWRFMVASLAIGFQNTARYGLLIWVPVYFLGKDWKGADATKWISIALPVGMALGAMTSGWISDALFKAKRSPVIIICMFMASVCAFLMYLVPSESWLVGMIILFFSGFFVYGAQSSFWALSPDLLGRKRTSTGIGVMNFFAYALAGLGEPLIGFVIETNDHEYGLVFPLVGTACLISAFMSLFIRR
jgi:OPA family glycerol-3-phosphate transporter-like MFS transporter